MSEDLKSIARRVLDEMWNKGNLDIADEFVAPNYILNDPIQPGISGPEGAKQMISMFRTAFPDVQWTFEDQIAEGDKVMTRFTSRGTHKGELMGIPPTEKKIAVTGITVARFESGKVVEEWVNWDTMGMMQQLGVVPTG